MALTPDALEYRETPIVSSNFVVINVAIGTAQPLFSLMSGAASSLNGVGSVGTANGHTYPLMPIGVLISANTAAVLILTDNSGAHTATGINIPIGQSLYLPISAASVATLQYTCSAVFSMGVFFAE